MLHNFNDNQLDAEFSIHDNLINFDTIIIIFYATKVLINEQFFLLIGEIALDLRISWYEKLETTLKNISSHF